MIIENICLEKKYRKTKTCVKNKPEACRKEDQSVLKHILNYVKKSCFVVLVLKKNITKSWQSDKKDNNKLLSDLKFTYKI